MSSNVEVTDRLIDEIQRAVPTAILEVDGKQVTTKPVYELAKKPFADNITVASLTGVIDYLNDGIDDAARVGTFVQVAGPTCVTVFNQLGTEQREERFCPLEAVADVPQLYFDQFRPKEEVMIYLQSRFVETAERAELLEQIGTIVAEEELIQEDDGVAQGITLQKGVRRQTSTIVNPVTLRPFRTFSEVEQPASPFIVRLKKTDDGGILVALFEADGGAWRNTARQSIKAFIDAGLTDGYPVIA